MNAFPEDRITAIWQAPTQDIREHIGGRPVGICEVDGRPCIVACVEQGTMPVAVDLRELLDLVAKRWPDELRIALGQFEVPE